MIGELVERELPFVGLHLNTRRASGVRSRMRLPPAAVACCAILGCTPPRPHAVDDTASVLEDQSVLIDVRENDRNVDRVVIVDPIASHGEIRLVGDRVEYTPDPDFYGTDSFSYTGVNSAADLEEGVASTARVTVSVTPDRKPPRAQELSVPGWPLAVATGDFDRDQLLDLVTLQQDRSVVIFLQRRTADARPAFESFVAHAAEEDDERYRELARRRSLIVGDLDGDGWLDLACTRRRADILLLFNRGQEELRFEETSLSHDDVSLADAQTLAAGDLDCDGSVDLVAATFGYVSGSAGVTTDRIRVFPSLAYEGATLSHAPSRALDRSLTRDTELRLVPRADGCADLLFTTGDTLEQLQWQEDGTLTAETWARTPYYFHDLATADLDRDGRAEILMTPSAEPVLLLSESALETPSALDTRGELIAIGDFDAEDQGDEVAITDRCQLRIFASAQRNPLTLEPRGDVRIFEPPSCPFVSGIAAADLDGDGRDDLIVAHGDYQHTESGPAELGEGLTVLWSREVE